MTDRILRHLVPCAIALLLCPISSRAQAPETNQEPPSSLDALRTLVKPGDVVYVMDDQAQETTGIFVKVSESRLSILVNGEVRDKPLGAVRQIARRGDSVSNGFLIGAGIGAGLGAASGCSEHDCYGWSPSTGAIFIGLEFGGIGALIDFFIKGRTTIYRAPEASRVSFAPIVGRGRHGVSVALALPRPGR
jgi:hypothetical protein